MILEETEERLTQAVQIIQRLLDAHENKLSTSSEVAAFKMAEAFVDENKTPIIPTHYNITEFQSEDKLGF